MEFQNVRNEVKSIPTHLFIYFLFFAILLMSSFSRFNFPTPLGKAFVAGFSMLFHQKYRSRWVFPLIFTEDFLSQEKEKLDWFPERWFLKYL